MPLAKLPGTSAPSAERPWNIVVLHDDRSACRRAVSTLGKILPKHARAKGVRSVGWQFSDFEDSGQRQEMADAIQAADLIVVAPSADAPVPMETVEWLGRLLSQRTDRIPSVITVCDPAGEARDSGNVSAALLRRIAIAAGMVGGSDTTAGCAALHR